ncbi:MAG TPA: hypothetical protein VFY68_18520 [Nitrososphaeraceae archaeon]|nr:hypothetical protein [Nitrososphaeraceae archaeon]
MLKSKKSILNKFMIAKDELVSMRLHFRYHVYLYAKKDYINNVSCKYCQVRFTNGIVMTTDENQKSERDNESLDVFKK